MIRTAIALLLLTALSGCFDLHDNYDSCWRDVEIQTTGSPVPEPAAIDFDANPTTAYADMGFNGSHWPDLSGHKLVILDHGAFDFAFEPAELAFENLTGADVTHIAADDAGTALQLAIQDQKSGGGSFDVIYGIDNALMTSAMDGGIFAPYTPLHAERVAEDYRFIPTIDGAWAATPVDMGYIAINVDSRAGLDIDDMGDLVDHADRFVTQDPRFSSPGLGFLLATVATYGEDCYLGYWEDLLENDVTITNGWTEAYVDHFSGGYGQWEEGTKQDKPIVNSYTTSPAFEVYYGAADLNDVLTAPQSAFQQIQTMGILKGAPHRAAAEAWIEFTLTDDFQNLAAGYNAIYPVVETDATQAATDGVYGGNDPAPGTFTPVTLTSEEIGDNVAQWVEDWVELYRVTRI